MTFSDISMCVSSLETDFSLLDQAIEITQALQAHLSCCAIGIQSPPMYADGFSGSHSEIAAVMQAGEESFRAFSKALDVSIERHGAKIELRSTRSYESGLAEVSSIFARYSDILLARMPENPDRAKHGEIIEGGLFGSGRPVLTLPKNWKPRALGQKVLFAWDASREASRAIHDALPLMTPSTQIFVVTIDATPTTKGHGASPGLDIGTHLARHGFNVTVRNEDSLGKSIGERLVNAATGLEVDMIVMGGYRHSKLAQRLVGGPSHYLIGNSPVPVFLSH